MNVKLFQSVLFITFWLLVSSAVAQITKEGKPVFFQTKENKSLSVVDLPPFAAVYQTIKQQEKTIGVNTKAVKYAHEYKVKYNTGNSGIWDILPDGRKVWRFAIQSKGAYSLGVRFSKYRLPKGAELFIYNSKNYLGAFTEINNKPWETLVIQAFAGDRLIIEYVEPKNTEFKGKIEIGGILHDYKNILRYIADIIPNDLGDSGNCNVDINCDVGADWQIEKRAVCKVLSNGFYGSGVLLNNSNFDGIPYFLTAFHFISTLEEAHGAVFYFNFENTGCKTFDAKSNQTISGAELKALSLLRQTEKGLKPHLDFSLLKMSSQPPAAYNAYYAGWDCSGKTPISTITIHHPQGDAKKISIDNDAPETGTYQDGAYQFDDNAHWVILRWDLGTTEGGSSGAPLFDENHKVIGDLTGGNASCGNPVNDFYSKLSAAWDKFPGKENQLKYWLNPKNITDKTLNGFDPNAEFYANFSLSKREVCVNVPVNIVNLSSGDVKRYVWDFGEGAIPERKFIGKTPPAIRYQTVGIKNIILTVEKNGKMNRASQQIKVLGIPKADFNYILEGENNVNFAEKCIDAQSYLWNFGDGITSTDGTVTHSYAKKGTYKVVLKAANECGSNTTVKNVILSYDKLIKIYPNPSPTFFNIDLTKIKSEKVIWSLYSVAGKKIQTGIAEKSNCIKLNLGHLQTGVYFIKLNIDGIVIQRKLLKIN